MRLMNSCQDGSPTFIDNPAPANRTARRSLTASANSAGTSSSTKVSGREFFAESRLTDFLPPDRRAFLLTGLFISLWGEQLRTAGVQLQHKGQRLHIGDLPALHHGPQFL